jgi:hypothetical protein
MPIPVRSRRYDQQFWNEMKGRRGSAAPARTVDDINDELFG